MRILRLLAAAAIVGALTVTTGGRTASAAATEPAGVSLLGQSSMVRTGHDFTLHLGIPAAQRGHGSLSFVIDSALITRSAFDSAAAGHPTVPASGWSDSVRLGGPGTSGGEVTVRIPVDTASTGRQLGEFVPQDSSGVYPLQVQLDDDAGAAVGPVLSTFLVYDAGGTVGHPLAVSLTVPLPTVLTSPLANPTADEVATLARRVRALEAASGPPVSISILPRTLAALAESAAGRAVLAGLRQLVSRGDEILPSTWTNVSLPSMLAAGLSGEVSAQLDQGARATASALGSEPGSGTWVLGTGTDRATVATLAARGMRRLIVPASAVAKLPAAVTKLPITYGYASDLAGTGGSGRVEVVAADATLSARADQATGPVLAAEQTLAELAMIHFELPGASRGVAIEAPSGAVSDEYYTVLLDGLRHDPFVAPVTARHLFDRIPPQTDHHQALTAATAAPLAGAGDIASLARQSAAIAAVVPEDRTLLAELAATLLLAPTEDLSPGARSALIAQSVRRIDAVRAEVGLPGSTSVTLTSLQANLPLTILSTSRRALHVELVLDSPKLAFRHYAPAGSGSCRSSNRGHETCRLVLDKRQTTLRVPVEARTSGVFTLTVSLRSPDGTLKLAGARDTIRSTAVSSVGLVIIVVACLFLAIWWIRDIRSGRRARRLVERPDDGDDPPDGGGGPDDHGSSPGGSGDGVAPADRAPSRRVPVSAG